MSVYSCSICLKYKKDTCPGKFVCNGINHFEFIDKNECKNCNITELMSEYNYCPYCGFKLEEVENP